MEREKNVGGFLGETFDIVGRNIPAVGLFVALLGGASALGYILGYTQVEGALASFGMGFSIDADDNLVAGLFNFALFILTFIAYYFLVAQYLASSGRLRSTETRIWAYVGLYLLSLLGLVFGFLLLVIPGIFLMVKWSASAGFLVGEREGIVDSLKRSWDVTDGYGWQIFFGGLILGISLMVLGGAIGGFAAIIGNSTMMAVATGLAEAIGNAVFLAFGIAVFSLLHDNTEAVAEVFD